MRYVWLTGVILLLAMLYTPAMGEEPCACSDAIGQWDTTRVLMENGQPNAIEQLIPIREKMEIKEAGFCKLTGSFGNGGTITGTFLANSLQSGTDTNFGGEWSLGGKSGDANLKFYCEPGKGVTRFSGDMILKEENTRTEWRWEGNKAGTGCGDKSSENLVLVPGSIPPDCKYTCKPNLGEDLFSELVPGSVPPNCKYQCEKASDNEVLREGSTPPNCRYDCKDGYTFSELYGSKYKSACAPCKWFCDQNLKNEIADPKNSTDGYCSCVCDEAHGWYRNKQGECVSSAFVNLEDALKTDDRYSIEIAVYSKLQEDDDPVNQRLAILLLKRSCPKWDDLLPGTRSVIEMLMRKSAKNAWMRSAFE